MSKPGNSTTTFPSASIAAGAEAKEDDHRSRCTSRARFSSRSAINLECRR
jgi:hypothetical protein